MQRVKIGVKAYSKIFLIVVLLIFSLSSLFAQDSKDLFSLSLEELMNVKVVTASRKIEPIDEAPNVMYVITKEEIQRHGYKNLKDVLQNTPGFEVFLHALGQNVQVRGIAANENEKITTMINGQIIDQFFEPIHYDGPINLDNVERIEIIIGPGSVLYGDETLEAIVNLITKDLNNTEAIVTTGTDKTLSATVNVGRKYENNVNFFVSATYLQRGGYDAYTENALELGGIDGMERVSANLIGKDLIDKVNPSLFFTGLLNFNSWSFNYVHINRESPEYHIYRFKWGKEGSRFSYVDVVKLKNIFEYSENLEQTFEATYDSKRQLRSVTERGEISNTGPSFDLSQIVYGGTYSLQYKMGKHFLQGGIQYNYNVNRHNYVMVWTPELPMDSLQLESNTTFIENMIRMENTQSIGLYLSADYVFSEEMKMIVASRFDYNTIVKTDKIYASPRFALIYKPQKKWIIKALYNRATRMPNTWESQLNQVYGAENKPEDYNPEKDFFSWAKVNNNVMRPEILTDYELQSINYFGENRLAINFYYQELNDFISWNTPYTNVGDFTGFGGELEYKSNITNKLSIRFTFTYNNNDFQKLSYTDSTQVFDKERRPENPEGEMLAVPKHTGFLGFDYYHKLFGGTITYFSGIRYLTRMPVRVDITGNDEIDYTYADNRFYLDANIGWSSKNEKFRIDLTAKNLLNNQDYLSVTWNREFYIPRGTVLMLTLKYLF